MNGSFEIAVKDVDGSEDDIEKIGGTGSGDKAFLAGADSASSLIWA